MIEAVARYMWRTIYVFPMKFNFVRDLAQRVAQNFAAESQHKEVPLLIDVSNLREHRCCDELLRIASKVFVKIIQTNK